MDKIIHLKRRLSCHPEQAFDMFTKNREVQKWLAEKADIEPFIGGKYELYWDLDDLDSNSTNGCKITAIEANQLLCFEWKGPVQFAHFMNDRRPLTHVSITFIPSESGTATDIHLIHSGWGKNENWEEARLWFERVWAHAFKSLSNEISLQF